MKHPRRFSLTFGLALLVFLLAGCTGTPAGPTAAPGSATATPTPTPTNTPTATVVPVDGSDVTPVPPTITLPPPTTTTPPTVTAEPDDVGPVALVCPSEPVSFELIVNHQFNWSPGRQTDQILVEGNTGPEASCQLTVNGNKVDAAECVVPYTNAGTFKGDGGECEHSGEGTALVEIEGSCKDGKVTLEITEIQDPDASLGGTMTCPQANFTEPYVTFYPPSLTTEIFSIDLGGHTVTEDVEADPLGFQYHKQWTLIPLDFPEG